MIFESIIEQKAPRVILFFNGWGQSSQLVRHLTSTGYDVLAVSDYRCLPETAAENIRERLMNYAAVKLIAWSLGVFAAEYLFHKQAELFSDAVAVNGTIRPADDEFGIAPAIFRGTADLWSERSRNKFKIRMSGNTPAELELLNLPPERTVAEQQKELYDLLELAGQSFADKSTIFRRAYVGVQDKIFLPANQLAAWQSYAIPVQELPHPHAFWSRLANWEQLLNEGGNE
ncbi:MAG: DUF452 family protein [Victivallaceae bacterium]